MRRDLVLGLGVSLVLAGGAGLYALRAPGTGPDDGCPPREKLAYPSIDFTQAPRDTVTVTLTNPNPCYGFQDEPVEITLFGPRGRRAISYYGEGAPHSDVGVCCNVTLPPRGTWTIRLGSWIIPLGARDITICNIHVEALKSKGYSAWKRMPEGGAITGLGYYPPDFDPYVKPLPEDPSWVAPCGSASPRR